MPIGLYLLFRKILYQSFSPPIVSAGLRIVIGSIGNSFRRRLFFCSGSTIPSGYGIVNTKHILFTNLFDNSSLLSELYIHFTNIMCLFCRFQAYCPNTLSNSGKSRLHSPLVTRITFSKVAQIFSISDVLCVTMAIAVVSATECIRSSRMSFLTASSPVNGSSSTSRSGLTVQKMCECEG